jgi:hypothetical protein
VDIVFLVGFIWTSFELIQTILRTCAAPKAKPA